MTEQQQPGGPGEPEQRRKRGRPRKAYQCIPDEKVRRTR